MIVVALGPVLLALGYWAWPPKPEAVPALRPPLFPLQGRRTYFLDNRGTELAGAGFGCWQWSG